MLASRRPDVFGAGVVAGPTGVLRSSVSRIWPPEEELEQPLVLTGDEPLRVMCVYFELTLSSPEQARIFATRYGLKFTAASATARGITAWLMLRTGASSEQEAAVQAAMSVKIVADLKVVDEPPLAGKLHHTDDHGPVPNIELVGLAAGRKYLLDYAAGLGVIVPRLPGAHPGERPADSGMLGAYGRRLLQS
jgi:hypothetical protein